MKGSKAMADVQPKASEMVSERIADRFHSSVCMLCTFLTYVVFSLGSTVP